MTTAELRRYIDQLKPLGREPLAASPWSCHSSTPYQSPVSWSRSSARRSRSPTPVPVRPSASPSRRRDDPHLPHRHPDHEGGRRQADPLAGTRRVVDEHFLRRAGGDTPGEGEIVRERSETREERRGTAWFGRISSNRTASSSSSSRWNPTSGHSTSSDTMRSHARMPRSRRAALQRAIAPQADRQELLRVTCGIPH